MKSKKELCYTYTLKDPFENKNDPFQKLISNYEDIMEITKANIDKNNIKQFLYFNKNKIHNILFDADQMYIINENESINYSELFYLSLLITDNPEIINYTYSIKYIKLINNTYIKNDNIKKYQKIMVSKILLTLIMNFKDSYESNEDTYLNEIKQIEDENINIIKKNLNIFNKINLYYSYNDFRVKKIDCIYTEIIIALIKEDAFINYQFCLNIIQQLELDKINITKTMFDGLSKALNKGNNSEINRYLIYSVNDLANEKKINFYYILFKYIFKKNSICLYNIDFLVKNINNFIQLNKKEINQIKLINIKKEIFKKIEEIFFMIPCRTKYYYDYINYSMIGKTIIISSFKENTNLKPLIYKNKNIKQQYSENNYFYNDNILENNNNNKEQTDKKEDNNLNNKENFGELINEKIDYNIAVKILEKVKIKINIFPEEKNSMYKTNIKYKEILYGKDDKKLNNKLENGEELKINANYDSMTDYDKIISEKNSKNQNIKKEDLEQVYYNYKKFADFIKEIEQYIKQSNIKFNPQIILELKREKKDNNIHKEFKELYNITCITTFYNQLEDNYKMIFKDENILLHSINGQSQGFINLINELINDDFIGANFIYDDNKDNDKSQINEDK